MGEPEAKPEDIRDLWEKGKFMKALSEAWRLDPSSYAYLALELVGLNPRDLVFFACRQAVETARTEQFKERDARKWVGELLENFSPPPALIDHKDDPEQAEAFQRYRTQMIRTYLHCTVAAMTPGPFGPATMEDIQETANEVNFPVGFVRDIVWSLTPEYSSNLDPHPQTPTVSAPVLLVDEVLEDGFPALLTLERMPAGSGALYPHPDLAFICRDEKFQGQEAVACSKVRQLWQQQHESQDIRWQLKRYDSQPITAIGGPSMGLAFTLGMAKLLVTE